METALIRSLMDKDFYDDHRGIKCPDKLFGKDLRKTLMEMKSLRHMTEASI